MYFIVCFVLYTFSNVTGIQLLKKKSQLAAIYRAKTSKKFQSPLIQLTKYGILPDIPSHRNTNKGRGKG